MYRNIFDIILLLSKRNEDGESINREMFFRKILFFVFIFSKMVISVLSLFWGKKSPKRKINTILKFEHLV